MKRSVLTILKRNIKMAGLTKQHFKEITEILKSSLRIEGETNDKTFSFYLSEDLSNYFKTQNPLFNENRFKKACLE